jgi:hypothetical protein
LIESDKKDILLAPALDKEAQKEAAHDSGAGSCLVGFKVVYKNYKEQQIQICTAGNRIYDAGIVSVGILQNVIHVLEIQRRLLTISQIFNQLQYYYLIDGTKCEVLKSNNEIVHTCYCINLVYASHRNDGT